MMKNNSEKNTKAMTLEEAKAYCFSCHFTPSAMAQNTIQNGRYLRCEERHQYYDIWLGEYFDLVFEKLNTPGEKIGLWFYNFHIVWGQMRGKEYYKPHLEKLYLFLKDCVNYSTDVQLSILYDIFGGSPGYSGLWTLHLYKDELPRFKEVISKLIQVCAASGEAEKVEKYNTYLAIWEKYEKEDRLDAFKGIPKGWESYL